VIDILGPRLEHLLREGGGTLPPCMPAIREVRGIEPRYLEEKLRDLAKELEHRGWPLAARAVKEQTARVIALYATILNSRVAHDRNMAPVTDDPTFDAACTYFAQGRVSQEPKNVGPEDGLAAAQLFVPTPSIDALGTLSVERLVRIREDLGAARRRFRDKIQARVSAMSTLPSADAVREHMKALGEEIRGELTEARESIRRASITERWSLLGVSAPAALAVGVALAGQSVAITGPLGGVASAAFGVTTWFFEHRKPGHDPAGNYLLSLEAAVEESHSHRLTNAMKHLFVR
jgi:hypothetical protein